MIQLNILQACAVITACGTAMIVMVRVGRGVLSVVSDIKRMMWEHDQMWVDYCLKHKIPIRTTSKGYRKPNGDLVYSHVEPTEELAH